MAVGCDKCQIACHHNPHPLFSDMRLQYMGRVALMGENSINGYIVGEEKHRILCGDRYNTGDVGYIDEHGEPRIVGRTDDVIRIDAHKIYPSQIDAFYVSDSNADGDRFSDLYNQTGKVFGDHV